MFCLSKCFCFFQIQCVNAAGLKRNSSYFKKQGNWIPASYLDHEVKKESQPWTEVAYWRIQVTPWRKGSLSSWLEGRRGAVSWLASCGLRRVSIRVSLWNLRHVPLSSSQKNYPVYIRFTRITWPQIHYINSEGNGKRGKGIWRKEGETGSRAQWKQTRMKVASGEKVRC